MLSAAPLPSLNPAKVYGTIHLIIGAKFQALSTSPHSWADNHKNCVEKVSPQLLHLSPRSPRPRSCHRPTPPWISWVALPSSQGHWWDLPGQMCRRLPAPRATPKMPLRTCHRQEWGLGPSHRERQLLSWPARRCPSPRRPPPP